MCGGRHPQRSRRRQNPHPRGRCLRRCRGGRRRCWLPRYSEQARLRARRTMTLRWSTSPASAAVRRFCAGRGWTVLPPRAVSRGRTVWQRSAPSQPLPPPISTSTQAPRWGPQDPGRRRGGGAVASKCEAQFPPNPSDHVGPWRVYALLRLCEGRAGMYGAGRRNAPRCSHLLRGGRP